MSLPIYQRVAVTDAGDVIPGAEYTVINENTGVAAPIYSDRTGATLLSAPYFADSVGTIQFFIAQGTTFRVAASGGVGTYTDRYVYGVAEAVLVQADGNVGIDTTVPFGKLSVNVNSGAPSSSGNMANGLTIHNTDGGRAIQLGINETGAYSYLQSAYVNSANVATPLAFFTGAAERLRIDSAGNVGIGTSSPTNYTPFGYGSSVEVSGGTGGSLIVSDSGQANKTVLTNYSNTGEGILKTVTNKSLHFATNDGSPQVTLSTVGNLTVPAMYNNTSGGAANLGVAPSGEIYRSTSSLKYKRDVENAVHGLAEVLSLRPVTYKGKNERDGENIFGGLIAEEVHAAGLAEFVEYAEDGSPDALAYGNMVSICVKAIQEQQKLIEALTARIEALEG